MKNNKNRRIPMNLLFIALGFWCVLAINNSSALAQITFGSPNSVQTGKTPVAAVTGDFNRDGNLDAATANSQTSDVSILFGDGAGGFSNLLTQTLFAEPESVTTGDFNNDGLLDYATANGNASNVSVGFGNTGGGFVLADFAVGARTIGIAAGDFNRDGFTDLIVPHQFSVSILISTGNRSFQTAVRIDTRFNSPTIAVSDFDNDGKLDFTVRDPINDIGIYRGDGLSGFTEAALIESSQSVRSLLTGDFNNDGKPDVFSAGSTGNSEEETVGIASVNLNTTFTATCSNTNFSTGGSPTGTFPHKMATADFNNDGKLDFAVARDAAENLTVRFGNGNGNFAQPTNYSTGGTSREVVAGDFNRDGYADLATANYNTNNVSILLNNRSGNFPSVVNIVTGNEPLKITAGDFNKDGKLDLATVNGFSSGTLRAISILSGNGSGGFSPPVNFPTGGQDGEGEVTVGDFNRDGNLDFSVVHSFRGTGLRMLFGDGAGGFGAPVFAGNLSGLTRTLTSGDFNRDGKLDLAVGASISNILGLYTRVQVLIGNGDGTFTEPTFIDIEEGEEIFSIVTSDFNNDGKLDLAVANAQFEASQTALVFSILRGDGAGNFAALLAFTFPSVGARAVIAGDFNRDGKSDVLSSLDRSNAISLSLNTCVENIAPVAANDTFAGREVVTLNVPAPGVLANDTDIENHPLTAILVQPPSLGTVMLNPDGSFAYTPPSSYIGTVSFTYKVSDGRLESNTATVSITINNPPIANNDFATLGEDGGAFPIFVLQNDSAAPNEFIVGIVAVTQGANGTVAGINNNQALTYTPNPNFFGTDTFTYTIIDNNGGLTATATVFVTVVDVNDPPVANDDYAEIMLNSPATTIDVLANDSIAPDADETLQITAVTQGANGGAVVITNNGANLTYQPPFNFESSDTFTYTVSDGRGGTDTASVTVDVPNTLIVTNNTDDEDGVCDSNCSLREAIIAANTDVSRTIIEFAPQVRGTIQLTFPPQNNEAIQLGINSRIDLRGPGSNLLNVRGRIFFDRRLGPVFKITQGLSRISGLTVSNGSSFKGGGMVTTADVSIENCVVTGNDSGIAIFNGRTTINNSTISNNISSRDSRGGGITVGFAELTLINSTVSGNISREDDEGAGGIESSNSKLIIKNSTISGNSTTPNENSSFNAGAIYASGANAQTTITNSTITNNQARFFCGIYAPKAVIGNSIIAGNSEFDGNLGIDISDGFNGGNNPQFAMVSLGYNLIGNVGDETFFNQPTDQTGGGGNPILNPLLAPLAGNGGATQTHAPLAGSPAIDKGGALNTALNTAFTSSLKNVGSELISALLPPLTADQRGLPRPFDNPSIPNAAGGDGSDIGAVEMQAAPTAANVSIGGRVLTSSGGTGAARAIVTLTDMNGATRSATTNSFGYYNFTEVAAGGTYIIAARHKSHQFTAQIVTVTEDVTDLYLIAESDSLDGSSAQ